MLLLRDVLRENQKLKLVLMSATAESGLFASYFEKIAGGHKGPQAHGSVSVVDIPGFTYPVRELSLEDAVQRLLDEGVCCSLRAFCFDTFNTACAAAQQIQNLALCQRVGTKVLVVITSTELCKVLC